MRDEIIAAIQGRRLIKFSYNGITREAKPCAVGISRAGNEVMRCYQVHGGHIERGHDWDLCDLSKIRSLIITDNTFNGEPPDYRRGDRGMKHTQSCRVLPSNTKPKRTTNQHRTSVR